MSTVYPSRKQILEKIGPELEKLEREKIRAEYEAPNTPAIDYHKVVGERRPREQFLSDHVRFLVHVQDFPSAGMADHYKAIGGAGKGLAIAEEVEARGFIKITRRPGAAKKTAELTPAGTEFIKSHEA